MKTVCEKNTCTGCGACSAVCPVKAVTIKESDAHCYAEIHEAACIQCGKCERVCQSYQKVSLKEPIAWHQGWAVNESTRKTTSSGGIATALSEAFIRAGGEVCTCIFENGTFGFQCVNEIAGLEKAKGSKYVKTRPEGVYLEIKKKLSSGKKLLFIGLPCQVAAVKNVVGPTLEQGLYTIDLICHGTPTQETLSVFLKQQGYDLSSVKELSFRKKGVFGLWVDGKSVIAPGVRDPYMIAFLNAVNYTENCYSCTYAQLNRPGDITLGDSWGSQLTEEEQRKGVSLILAQTEKGKKLLEQAEVSLFEVDLQKAVEANHQLRHPSPMPKERELYLKLLAEGNSFHRAIFRCYPKQSLKQAVKRVLVKLHVLH